MNPLTQSKHTTILAVVIAPVLACFALSPEARATCQDACLTNNNTVQGDDALISNTTGINNTAIGFNALFSNTLGDYNTAIGYQALYNNIGTIGTGLENTAIGASALFNNTTGLQNTASGVAALFSNTTGNNNTATGKEALSFNTTGSQNTADGEDALHANSVGINNTADGFGALFLNTRGTSNTATGAGALQKNVIGSNNTADGFNALFNNKGNSNTAVGVSAGINLTTGNNNIDIGNVGVAAESNTIRMGTTGTQTNTYVAGISGVTVANGVGVIIDTNGHLGTLVSSARFKEAVKPMDKASDAILALKPVTFHYKHELDPKGIAQFGLVAEDVEKVNPDLVARDEQGKPYSVRYEAVNAMLLNEFLKEHRKVENQQRKIESLEKAMAEQQKENAAMRAMLSEQAAQIQKVSAQLELSKSAPQTVLNNQ